ncbi:MAG: hypothetical protein JG782_1158 [Anaerophaga sp.]|nr:hypothetical protein [Anaerophaga sp.]MDI3520551.1 hypothetical protein [Anaerophaga sp.]MDK2842439.1 hypothetical protein [Anaerophaga sp.]MDN5290713.1 hypothetical protein [Anaerophaga sp.]
MSLILKELFLSYSFQLIKKTGLLYDKMIKNVSKNFLIVI